LTSRGLDHESAATGFGAYADADHRAYEVLSLRRLPTPEEVDWMIRTTGETNRLLKQEARLRPGRQAIVFTPAVTEAMLNKYLFTNLDGQRVLNGAGAFSIEQFREAAEVFHPDFSLTLDPLQPLSPGAYALTREGVPARVMPLIASGKLQTPLLDLKHARRADLPPTPFPRGGSSLRFGGPSESFEAMIAGLSHGLVVYQLLGLHTQDAVRGNFSLTVSQGLVVEDGQVRGHAKAIIAGNFLQALREGVHWGTLTGKDVPALLVHGDVTAG
jgi:PmbA protein